MDPRETTNASADSAEPPTTEELRARLVALQASAEETQKRLNAMGPSVRPEVVRRRLITMALLFIVAVVVGYAVLGGWGVLAGVVVFVVGLVVYVAMFVPPLRPPMGSFAPGKGYISLNTATRPEPQTSGSPATALQSALEPVLGKPWDRIHTALPPLTMGGEVVVGGGAHVIEFRESKDVPGIVHLSAGLGEIAGMELVVCTRKPDEAIAPLLSKLAATACMRPLRENGSAPIAGVDAGFEGFLFTRLECLAPREVAGKTTEFLLCVGIRTSELAACRSLGTPHVVEKLRAAGVFPYTEPGRSPIDDEPSSSDSRSSAPTR